MKKQTQLFSPLTFLSFQGLGSFPVLDRTNVSFVISSVDVKQICRVAIRAGMMMNWCKMWICK
jgi:hypothetical protein